MNVGFIKNNLINIMKKIIVFVAILGLFLNFGGAFAKPVDNEFRIPSNALEVAPNVFSLGQAYDKQSNLFVEGYAIVHKKEKAKNGSAKLPRPSACYVFLATGAKWKNVENWTVFPGAGLSGNFVLGNTANNIAKWEAASGVPDILGSGSLGIGSPSDPKVSDDKNEISFGNLDANTIAVTIIWGNFGGPTFNRRLTAWDQIYNTDFDWSENATGSTTEMDFENISTHELGHSMGMDDVYNSACADVTMYGSGTEGEIQKRDLAPADILGISTLY